MRLIIPILLAVGGPTLKEQSLKSYTPPPVNIMIIASYNEYDPCGYEQIKGITDEFNKGFKAESLRIKVMYMRGRKVNLTREAREAVADSFYHIFKSLQPKVVFLLDDIAIEYMLPKLVCDKCDYIVVFSGMNRDINYYDGKYKFIGKWLGERAIPAKNVTGVIEKIFVKLSLRFAIKTLHPDVKKDTIVFLLGKDHVSGYVKDEIKKELHGFNDIAWRFMEVGTFEEFLNALKDLQRNKRVPFYYPITLVIDSSGKRMAMNDLIPYYKKYIHKPDITLNKFFCQLGLFGGIGLNFYEMGKLAAKKAVTYLSGISLDKIKIQNADSVETVFNVYRTRKLKVKIPLGAIINAKIIEK